jgi:tRNA dimethylallyltransferase
VSQRGQRIAIVATTASGKSELAMALAAERPVVEIVCVDAMQVYRRMDIGTAKPSIDDQLAVRHHCLDLVEPSDRFNVADFRDAATTAADGIADRAGIALFVAGTGLYLKALTDRFEPPGQWPHIRVELEADPDVATLFSRLQQLDPVAATKMEPTNARRIVRALEVCLGSGRAFSSFGPGVDAYPPSDITQVGMRWSRPVLADRIARRVESMLGAGLVAEVEALLNEPRGLSSTARQALGYKELIEYVEGRSSLEAAIALTIQRTRQFAVRQERWFRRDPRIRWVELTESPLEALPVLHRLTA